MKRFLFIALSFCAAALFAASCNVADDAGNTLLPGSDCPEGQVLCSGECFDLDTSNNACGACGNVCEAGQVCTAGACELVCPGGYVACDGACVNPQNDANWCGAADPCDPADTSLQCTDGQVCSAGSCELVCADGTILCDGRCIDPDVDRDFCGASGNCSGGNVGAACLDTEVCNQGRCDNTCPTGSIGCDGGCIDPNTNPRFCGASGTCAAAEAGVICAPGDLCREGTCVTECSDDKLLCDGTCIDPMNNPKFCGAVETCQEMQAGEVCGLGEACLGGTCFPTNYFLVSPFGTVGTRTHPRDLAYRVDTLVDGITMHYTVDGSNPEPGMGTTQSTTDFVDSGALTNDTELKVVFDDDGVLSNPVTVRHRTDTNIQFNVNTPDNFSLNGDGIITTVEPGEEVNVTFDMLIWKLAPETSAQAVYFVDGVGLIHCESLAATPPGIEKALDLTFTAPSEPGTYFLRSGVDFQDDCAAVTDGPALLEPHGVVKVR